MTNEPQRRMDTYGPEDMAIPEWRVVQKVGGDWAKQQGAQPGNFHNTGSDEIADEINIVVVDILTGRAKWGAEISDAGPVCASMDAKSNVSMNGDDCGQCPSRLDTPWSAEATERRRMCCLNYAILAINLNDYMPCLIRAHGISALPTRQLLTQLKLNRALRGQYYRAVVNIKSQEKATKYGTAYALHPRVVELITDESKAEELKTESNRLLGIPIALPEGRPEEEAEPMGFTPGGTPFYSEEEKQKLMAPIDTTSAEPPPHTQKGWRPSLQGGVKIEGKPIQPATTVTKPEAPKEEEKEPTKIELDLDF